ncbi:CheR family methyltransferase [Paucibacter soli]|uniref:CheR family methyltransferase n=1 Tax=Paucibacter soli TaxID=3133433 RepID=UPI00309C4F85
MSLHFQAGGQVAALLGHELAEADVERLRAWLADPGEGPRELRCYDADQLPTALIEQLCARLDAGLPLKILAYHGRLAQRLARLGLPVRQAAAAPPPRRQQAFRVLALAGSAQSLDKILRIVEQLPSSALTVFIAQHVHPEQPNLLDQLLKVRTDYAVLMPRELSPVQAGTIYVAPPAHHMKVAHGLIYLTRDRPVQYARPSIDVLFESLAGEYGAGVLAALLCGYGQDGVQGCAALRQAGAMVLAESGDDCGDARVMPDAARDAGHVERVLPLPALVSVLAAAAAGDAWTEAPLGLFLEALRAHCGQDFRHYQRDSLERRVRQLMSQLGLPSFLDFQLAVLCDPAVLERFNAELPVGVTSFFRHPEQLRELREQALPYLQSFSVIKLWCAGCSTGEEAYSLAVMLAEAGLAERSHLFATDLNPDALEMARSGLYPAQAVEAARAAYSASGGQADLSRYLSTRGRLGRVAPSLQQQVLFYRHSLVDEGIFNEFQLIVCRNVLIYFSAALQAQVLQRFAQSLHADGLLVLGPQDGMSLQARAAGFEPLRAGGQIFHRRGRG